MTLIFNPKRAVVRTHTYKNQGQRSVGSKDIHYSVIKRTDGQTDASDCITFPANAVDKKSSTSSYSRWLWGWGIVRHSLTPETTGTLSAASQNSISSDSYRHIHSVVNKLLLKTDLRRRKSCITAKLVQTTQQRTEFTDSPETRFSSCYDFLPQKKTFLYTSTVDFEPRKSWLHFASYRSSGRD